MTCPIAPAWLITPAVLAKLTPIERIVLAYRASIWNRPEQQIPRGDWRYLGLRAGRGWGKSYMIAPEINRLAASGKITEPIALIGPNSARVDAVQIKPLIELAPPWFRPERYKGGLRWPNGVQALAFTAETERGAVGNTYQIAWATELVAWDKSTGLKVLMGLAEAVRAMPAKIFYDSTSSGKNAPLLFLERDHERDPRRHLIIRGTTFDNPLLPRKYLESVCAQYPRTSRRYREEILGETFAESAGALWTQESIDDHRREIAPTEYALKIVALDPAQSTRADADETGIVVACRDSRGEIYVLDDLSGRHEAHKWAAMIVDQCEKRGASGVVTERNNSGDPAHDLIKVIAESRGMKIEDIAPETPFPPRVAGRIYFKAYQATRAKHQRAEAPAHLYTQGKVHHVGVLDTLETQMTTWEPDLAKSPDRLDALAYAVAELSAMRTAPNTGPSDMAAGALAQELLRERLRRMPSRRI